MRARTSSRVAAMLTPDKSLGIATLVPLGIMRASASTETIEKFNSLLHE
jgi:hypothetical protein